MDTVANMIEAIKSKIRKEELYGAEIIERVKNVTCTKALYDAVYPLMQRFWQQNNQDQLFESLFGLIPKSCNLLGFDDYQAVNLVMIDLPDHLVAFYYKSRGQNVISQEDETASHIQQTQLNPAERGPLTYVSGYVVAKLFQTSKRAKNPNCELQSLLQNMKSLDESSYISARTRGGLVHPSKDLVGILEESENIFRKEVSANKSSLRNIPTDLICNTALESPLVKSLWENIVLSSGVDPSGDTQKLCLENIIKLYLKVRSFSYARDYLNRHKIKEKQVKKKALGTELKNKSAKM